MTFKDATNILMGSNNAATIYLNKTTSQPLYEKFNPVIVSSLDKIGANSPVSYTHLRAHETVLDLVCRLLLEKKTTYRNYLQLFHATMR